MRSSAWTIQTIDRVSVYPGRRKGDGIMLQRVAKRSRERDRRRRMYYARLDADEATRIHGVTQETKKNEHRKKKTNRGQESSLVGSLSRVLVMCDKAQEYESAR